MCEEKAEESRRRERGRERPGGARGGEGGGGGGDLKTARGKKGIISCRSRVKLLPRKRTQSIEGTLANLRNLNVTGLVVSEVRDSIVKEGSKKGVGNLKKTAEGKFMTVSVESRFYSTVVII